jgi:hypothetical protein
MNFLTLKMCLLEETLGIIDTVLYKTFGWCSDRYRLGYSLFGGSGDDSQGAAEFNVSQFGVYIQDNFKITNNFKFSYGLRVDVPVWDKGTVNNDFNTRTIPC